MTKTVVVILNYNGRDWLQKFLPSVIKFTSSARIIVADNCSSDGSGEVVRLEFPGVELMTLSENLGFSGGYNQALAKVEAEYYLLLNSDVEVTEGWLDPLISLLDKHPDIAAVQPRILSYTNKNLFDYAGAGGGFIDTLGYPFCRGRIFDSIEEDHSQYNECLPVFWASGACMLIRANVFHNLGGFDADFFAHMEEIDLCWKLQRAGRQVYYQGESKVYHVGGGTLSKLNPQKTYLNFRNGLSLIFKHMRRGELYWKLPLRIVMDWIAILKFVVEGKWKHGWAIVRAHVQFMIDLPRCYRKRKALRRSLGNRNSGPVYPRSVVVDYFVLGKRNFRDLRF